MKSLHAPRNVAAPGLQQADERTPLLAPHAIRPAAALPTAASSASLSASPSSAPTEVKTSASAPPAAAADYPSGAAAVSPSARSFASSVSYYQWPVSVPPAAVRMRTPPVGLHLCEECIHDPTPSPEPPIQMVRWRAHHLIALIACIVILATLFLVCFSELEFLPHLRLRPRSNEHAAAVHHHNVANRLEHQTAHRRRRVEFVPTVVQTNNAADVQPHIGF